MNDLSRNETLVIITISFVFGVFISYVVANFAFHTKPESVSATSKIGGSSLATPASANVLTTSGSSPTPNRDTATETTCNRPARTY